MNQDEYEKQTIAAIGSMGRRADKAIFTNNPSPTMPLMPCQKCGGRLSVAMPDYYAGILSCDECRAVASVGELDAWYKLHRPEYERKLAEWEKDWSTKP
jgi:hypothetical protein